MVAVALDYDSGNWEQVKRLYERGVAAREAGAFVVASDEELARAVARMPTEEAPEAATRLRVDVPRLLEQVDAEFGDDDEVRILSALLERVELSASAEDGDVVADAELRWAR